MFSWNVVSFLDRRIPTIRVSQPRDQFQRALRNQLRLNGGYAHRSRGAVAARIGLRSNRGAGRWQIKPFALYSLACSVCLRLSYLRLRNYLQG